jgi:hypothetical protein
MFTKTDTTSLAAVPGRGCYMFIKTDATPLAAVPGTEAPKCSFKQMLLPWLLFQGQRLLHVHLN